MLEILYQDEYLVAINKPHDLLVHQSPIARDASEFAIQLLRDQIQQKVYPVHRLDRKTSGVLLFALDKETNKNLTQQFTDKTITKTYWAILRGFAPQEMRIDYALFNDAGIEQDAVTQFKTLQTAEIQLPFGKHQTSRYSLVEAKPETGRMHQLRKHFAHIMHPILGDRPHGCNKQNKLWLETHNMNTMLLHAKTLQFQHPKLNTLITIEANLSDEFNRVAKILDFNLP
ncbi:pseudouridylate synthase [Flavobacterium agricola]|uniref:tRNA pseudouridine synthase C n=1 Tax=Flavobacterium agricola TaxID=2870839 RepID=A0ABY6LW48_9FLAO|nr:pseudouridine synthase [Flavobacterium agricola]UYW00461.1 pseudouridylate synthase [Flavobacterium agricola]